jgi:PAS domain S-box-containing protein
MNLPNGPSKFPHNGILRDNLPKLIVSNQDRQTSFLNILKGVEEYILNSDGVIISSNLEAVNITGYEEWEVMGSNWSIFYTNEDQINRLPEQHLKKSFEKGVFYTSGIRMKKRNSPFYCKTRLEAIYNSVKQVTGFRLTLKDATHKAIYGVNLSQIRDEYLNLFNNSFVGIFRFKIDDYTIKMLNERGEQLIGRNWHQRTFDEIFRYKRDFIRLHQLMYENPLKRIEDFEFQLQPHEGSDNSEVHVSISCKAFSQKGYVEGVLVDITERKMQYEKMLAISNELENFIYHASHDLRAPIMSMLGLVNLLRKEGSANATEYLDHLNERIIHLDVVLKNLVFIAFNTTTEIQSDFFDINEEINGIVSEMNKDRRVFVELNLDEEALYSDQTRISTILRHIISNVFKHAFHGEAVGKLIINTQIDDGLLIIDVSDDGIGIHPDQMPKVFTLFHRGSSRNTGTGLGLYIVKAIVERMGGKVDLTSDYGKGTQVLISLPIIKAD